MSKAALRSELEKQGIALNEAAEALFADDRFVTSTVVSCVRTVQVRVADLGFQDGAEIARIHARAGELGLSLCPLEVAPHLRLQWLDQAEAESTQPPTRHRAPPGSVTVASPALALDPHTPKGFYLRRIGGVLWLRGYRADAQHVWSPEDRFIFCRVDDESSA